MDYFLPLWLRQYLTQQQKPLAEVPKDIASHVIFICAKALCQRDPSTLAQSKTRSIDQSIQVIIQSLSQFSNQQESTPNLPASIDRTRPSFLETLLKLKSIEPENLETLSSREIIRLVLYVAAKSSLEFVDPITSERVHTIGEQKTRQWEQRRGFDLDIKPVAANMYLTGEFHIGNSTLHNHSYPLSRHLLSALSISTFCARASGLRLVSEVHSHPLALPPSEEEMIAGARYLTKLGQTMFGRHCKENHHQHHAHLHDSEHEPHPSSNNTDNSNKKWCKYCTGAISCLVISALQEFSDELGQRDLNRFREPEPIESNEHQFIRKKLNSPPPFISFDHSHEYQIESAVSGFFALPSAKGKAGSLSDFVTNALGTDIPTLPRGSISHTLLGPDGSPITISEFDREYLNSSPAQDLHVKPKPSRKLERERASLKPMTRLEIDIAEAIATPSPVIPLHSLYHSMAAVSLGIHPSFGSVHEAIISRSRRASATSEYEGDALNSTPSNLTTHLDFVLEDSEEPVSSLETIKPTQAKDLAVSLFQDKFISRQTNEDLDKSTLVSPVGVAGVGHTSHGFQLEGPIKKSENLNESPDTESDDNATLLPTPSPVSTIEHSTGDAENNSSFAITSTSCDLDRVESSPCGTENQSSAVSDVTYDSNGYLSGSNSSDSASDHSPSEGSDGQTRTSKKHRRRRLLVDDAKRKQEQIERVKEQLKSKALGKIREQVSFWEEKKVLEQKDIGVVEVEDEATSTSLGEIEIVAKVDASEKLPRLDIPKRNMGTASVLQHFGSGYARDHGTPIVTGAAGLKRTQGKHDPLTVEPISPGNTQSSQYHDQSPNLAPPRESAGVGK